jgi:hypothetical protein
MGWFRTTAKELRRAVELIEKDEALYYVAGYLKSRADGHEDDEKVCLSTSQDYNGFTNYETWAVMLWIGNDESLHRITNEIGSAHDEEDLGNGTLAEALKSYIGERYGQQENQEPNLGTELLEAALSEVNWQEVARHVYEGSHDND